MFPNKAEKILFYPVTILATIFALDALLEQHFLYAAGLSAIAGLFWASPFIKNRVTTKTIRILFWLAFAVVFILMYFALTWILSPEIGKLLRHHD